MERLNWTDYFFEVVNAVAKRATCDRGKSGCIFVRDNSILTTGYVGSAPGQPHCDEVGHKLVEIREVKEMSRPRLPSVHCVRTIHAEINSILQAARDGISLKGSTVYCTMTPCYNCTMSIIRVGVKEVFCLKRYHKGEESIAMFKEAGINVTHMSDDIQEYDNQ